MRIPRYAFGRTNVSERESQRAGLMSPSQAAAGKAAKYDFLTDVSRETVDVLKEKTERDRKLEEKENLRRIQLAELSIATAEKEIKSDPRWTEQLVGDDPTQGVMREEWSKRRSELASAVSEITDEGLRNHAMKAMELRLKQADVTVDSLVAGRRAQTDAEISWDMTRIAADNEDWSMVSSMLEEMLEDGYITQPQYDTMSNGYENERTTAEADAILGRYRGAQMKGQEAADAEYQNLVDNPNSNPDVQSKIMAGAAALNAQFAKARSNEQDEILAKEIFDEQEWSEVIMSGEPIDLKPMQKAGLFSEDPVRNSQIYNRLRDQELQALASASTAIDIRAAFAAGEPVAKSKANMEAIDAFLPKFLDEEGVPEEARLEAKSQIYFGLRLVGQRDSELLGIAPDDPATMVRMAPLFAKLTNDVSRGIPDMGISDKDYLSNLMFRDRNYFGANSMEVAEEVMKLTLVDDEERKIREKAFVAEDFEVGDFEVNKDSGLEISRQMFNTMIDNRYDTGGVFGEFKETTLQDYLDYRSYLHDGYMMGGNFDDAAKFGRDKFLTSHPETNINGVRQIQKGGIPGDTSELRSMYLKEISGITFQTEGADGRYAAGRVDPEGITFENPVRDERGITFKIFYNGKPLPEEVVIDSSGNEVVIGESVTFDEEDLRRVDAYTAKEAYQSGLDTQLEENRAAQEKYNRTDKITSGPNPMLSAGGMPIGDQDFAGEKALLEAQKAESDRLYQERYPDF